MNSLTANPIFIGELDVYQYARQVTDDGVKHQIPLPPRHAFVSGDLQRAPLVDCESSTMAALGLEKTQFHRYSGLRTFYFARKRPVSCIKWPAVAFASIAIFPYSVLAMPSIPEDVECHYDSFVHEDYRTPKPTYERPLPFWERIQQIELKHVHRNHDCIPINHGEIYGNVRYL